MPPTAGQATAAGPDLGATGPGLADVVLLQRRADAQVSTEDEERFFIDTLAEYQWSRDVAGLAASTLENLIRPVVEVCDYYHLPPWRITPRHVDQYFAGPGKRAGATVRQKMTRIDHYYAFLEQRYGGEVFRRFGAVVESPVDPFNRPAHRGDYTQRIPPSARAMREFFATWRADLPNARKFAVACRDYAMAKLAYISGVRASELCGMTMSDLHWEAGSFGRFEVMGKGARRSGPRPREAYMFATGRELLWWYVEEVRGSFCDDPEHPLAPVWPSERLPGNVAMLNVKVAPTVTPSTFRKAVGRASDRYLTGPVSGLHPHLLRHACATHYYESGMSLWEVQKVLGHEWTTTTVRYVRTAQGDPELASMQAANRAVQRLQVDKGSLR
nr:site-specific integrase [Streptomyces sp. Wb2n-11]